jgi:hypothetical protein
MFLIKLNPIRLNPWRWFWGLVWNIIELYRTDFMAFSGPWIFSQMIGPHGSKIRSSNE